MARYANRATANSLVVGDRIQVTTSDSNIHGRETLVVTARKTGVMTLVVNQVETEVTQANGYRGRAQRWYLVSTNAGVLRMAPAEVAHFAGEDANAVKRAHAEALAENVARGVAQPHPFRDHATPAAEAPARTGRPFAFPLASAHVRVNRETGVEIRTCEDSRGTFYSIAVPSRTAVTGEVRTRENTLAKARAAATAAAADIREDIAAARAEAAAIDHERMMARVRQVSDWALRNHGIAFVYRNDWPILIDADHAAALTEDAARDQADRDTHADAVREAQVRAWRLRHNLATPDNASDESRTDAARINLDHSAALAREAARQVRAWRLRHNHGGEVYTSAQAIDADHTAALRANEARDAAAYRIGADHDAALGEDVSRAMAAQFHRLGQVTLWLARHGHAEDTVVFTHEWNAAVDADHAAALTEDIRRDIYAARTYPQVNDAGCRFQDSWADGLIDDAQYDTLNALYMTRLTQVRAIADAYAEALTEDRRRNARPDLTAFHRQVNEWRTRHGLVAPFGYRQVVAARNADHTEAIAEDIERDMAAEFPLSTRMAPAAGDTESFPRSLINAAHAEAIDLNAARDALAVDADPATTPVTMTCCGNTYPNVVATAGHSCPVVAPQLNRRTAAAALPVLPTPAQVRDLSAAEAVRLAADLNASNAADVDPIVAAHNRNATARWDDAEYSRYVVPYGDVTNPAHR